MSDLGVYVLGNDSEIHLIAQCDDDALAFCLRTLHAEEQITCDSMVGVLSLEDRVWIAEARNAALVHHYESNPSPERRT